MTPGYKTTSFWITIVMVLFGVLMSSGWFCTDHDNTAQHLACTIVGAVLALGTTLGYQSYRKAATVTAHQNDIPTSGGYDPTKSG